MAKNKKLELGDYDFDGELDLPSFDFGDGLRVKDDRSPNTKLAHAAAQGYKDTLLSPENMRNFVKKSLPRGYGEALDTADQTAVTIKGLYNTTAKEMRPVMNDIKKSSQRLVPAADKMLPKRMAAAFKSWTQSGNQVDGSLSKEQMQEAGIQATLGDVFQSQAEYNHKRNVDSDAQQKVRDGLSFTRHRDVLQNLAPMSQGIQELAAYQRKVGVNFQRKSLELQLRSYYVMAEALEEAKRQNLVTSTHLEGILKNTGLPDFVKMRTTESLKQVIRNRFLNGIGDSISDKRRFFVKNLIQKLGKSAQDKIHGSLDQVRMGLGAYESLAELREMQAQFGPQQSVGEQAAELGGGMLAGHQTNKLAGWINKQLNKNNKVVKGGNNLLYYLQNAPQLAQEWARSDKGIGKSNMGAHSGWLWALKDSIRSVMSPESTQVEDDKLEDTRNPDVFNRRTNRAITDVMPGYLARIYRELKIIRTGDENQELVEYDFTSNKFLESSKVTKNILNKLVGKGDKDWLKRELDTMVTEVGGKKLNPMQQKALGRLMMNNNLAGGLGDSHKYQDASSDVYRGVERQDAEAMAAMFTEFFKGDVTNAKRQTFARQFSQLGTRISDKRESMQDIVNLNQRHHLEALGLLEPGRNELNMERFRDYLLADDEPAVPASPAAQAQARRAGKLQRRDGRNNRVYDPSRSASVHSANTSSQTNVPIHQVRAMNDDSVDKIVSAVDRANAVSAVNDGNRILATIAEMLQRGIAVHGAVEGHAGRPGEHGRWWNRSVGSLFKGAGTGAFNAAKWLKDSAINSTRRANRFIGGGLLAGKDAAIGAGKWLNKKWTDFNDVYVEGDLKPRLLGWKLKAGKYYDQATGKVIKSYKDIKGAIVDENGNLVMTLDDAKKAFEQSRVGKRFWATMGFLKKQADDMSDRVQRWIPGIYGAATSMGLKAIKKFGEFLDQPQDIYVAGKKDPVLLAVTMRAGGYASRISSKEIRRPSQIDGPVVDEKGDVVLTAEQLAGGLFDKYGHPLKTGYRGLFQKGRNLVRRGLEAITGGLNRAKNFVTGGFGKITGDFSFGVGFQSRNQAVLLMQIRDMLNDRLPGERTTFADNVNVGGMRDTASSLKNKLSGIKAKLAEKKDKAKEKLSTLFEKFFGKKKVNGDEDGDGIRDGSYKDILRKQKEKLKVAKEKAAEKLASAKAGGKGVLGAGKSLLDRLLKKKDKDDAGGIDIDLDGGDHRRGRRGRGRGRAPRGPRGRGFWGRTKGLMGRGLRGGGRLLGGLGGGLLRGGLGLGSRLLGPAALLYGGYSTYQDLKDGNYGGAALDAGLTAGGLALTGGGLSALGGMGGALLGAGGAILGGIGAILASPVVLTGLALAAVGTAGYFGYKYLTRAKLDAYSTLRYAQYGFPASDDKHLQQIFDLEDQLKDAVTFAEGKAALDEKKVDVKKIISTLGIDLKNKEQVSRFVTWFDGRFKPVFLNAVAAVKGVNQSKYLRDVGDFTVAQKRQYLNVAKFPGGPYEITASPFADQSNLSIGKSEVATAIEMAEAALQKEEKSAASTGKDGVKAGVVAATTTTAVAAGLPGVKLPEKSEVLSDSKVRELAAKGKAGTGGVITMSGPQAMADVLNTGRLDALTALRYKTYGLGELVSDKVRALNLLEIETQKGVTIQKGVASWNGSGEQIVTAMGSAFGVQGVANDDAYSWLAWFNGRFLPTYLAYVSAMVSSTKKDTLEQAKMSLTSIQAVDVATMIYTAKGSYNGSAVSVWQIKETPWPGYQLNSDVKSTEGNFQSLKDQAKRATVGEESANVKQGVTNKSAGSETAPNAKPGFFGRLFAERNDAQGKPSGNIFSRIYNNAKDMITSSGGREIEHPGKGTGGDINAIPMPKGNGTWAALKETIQAAAKMVGVDDKLMATMAAIESGFNYTVKAASSSATGLYQFTRDTWNGMMKKYAGKYGIDPNTDPTDPRANALMGAEFIKQNAQALSGIGRKLTDTDLYMAHFLGAGGAQKMLSADQSAIAANILPDAARSNPTLFSSNGRPLTVAEFYANLNNLVQSKGKKFNLDDGSEKVIAASDAKPQAPKTVSIPVSDQSPMPVDAKPKAGSDAAPKVAAAAAATAVAADTPTKPTSTPEADAMAYQSERSRNINAQQQYQRDAAAEALGTTNQILNASLEVQKKILENSTDMLALMRTSSAAPKSEKLDQPIGGAQAAQQGRQRRTMTPAPVSMSTLN